MPTAARENEKQTGSDSYVVRQPVETTSYHCFMQHHRRDSRIGTPLHLVLSAAVIISFSANTSLAAPSTNVPQVSFTLACLWDTDTLAMESKAFPGLAEILSGRFERQPAKYYEVRLARVTAAIESDPSQLLLYDDAGVACDRLGRSDEAIGWMDRKANVLANMDASVVKDHQYRYHANLGTFYAHRWVGAGAKRETLEDLRTAEREITEAIRINPDAHFGREKYQLAAIRWLIELPPAQPDMQPSMLQMLLPSTDAQSSEPVNPAEAVRGLSGLIVLGNAWQSVDVHWALKQALEANGDGFLAELAKTRAMQLLSDGKKSFHPDFDASGMDLAHRQLWNKPSWQGDVESSDAADIKAFFDKARKDADAWSNARTQFMEARFAEGKHPDTHTDFWNGYVETPPARLPDKLLGGWSRTDRTLLQAVPVLTAIVVIPIGILVWLRKRRRAKHAKSSSV